MMRRSHTAAAGAAALAMLVTFAVPAAGQSGNDGGSSEEKQDPEALAREGAERLMRALEGILQIIPQYGMPRIEEDGDIVIPRLNPPEEEKEKKDDAPSDGTDEGDPPQTEI